MVVLFVATPVECCVVAYGPGRPRSEDHDPADAAEQRRRIVRAAIAGAIRLVEQHERGEREESTAVGLRPPQAAIESDLFVLLKVAHAPGRPRILEQQLAKKEEKYRRMALPKRSPSPVPPHQVAPDRRNDEESKADKDTRTSFVQAETFYDLIVDATPIVVDFVYQHFAFATS